MVGERVTSAIFMNATMNRRDWIRTTGLAGAGLLFISNRIFGSGMSGSFPRLEFSKADFGPGFKWGVAEAAYQSEGAWNADGKSESNWDHFSHKKGRVERGENADVSADFYHHYAEDISLVKKMNFKIFRFSISWARILPNGTGEINHKGLDFYNRVIDKCLAEGIEPWVTIYHWDMPQVLEEKGGWTNRSIVDWFSEFVNVVTLEFGDRVKNWMVINEQLSYTSMGYMEGHFAPGRHGLNAFMSAIHYSVLCNAEGGRIVRKNVPGANIGTTFLTSWIEPVDQLKKNIEAAKRLDALMNRLFIEPTLGLGYPEETLPILRKIHKFIEPGDNERMAFEFDFIGIQYYFRTIVKRSWIPGIRANQVPASKRGVSINEIGVENYPEGLYRILKQFSNYKGIKNLIVTENGTCIIDKVENEFVHDNNRVQYFNTHLAAVLKAKKEGVNVNGYFVWSLTDNFEWDKGYRPRFGLVHVDFNTLQRTMKDSGLWFKEFLK